MAEYACSVCGYTSQKKDHVTNHINRKKSCGSGVKEIIEIPIEIKCKFCNKQFSCSISLKYHIKHNCKHRDNAKDEEIKKLKEENKLLKSTKNITNNIDNSTNNSTNNINIIIVNKQLNDKERVEAALDNYNTLKFIAPLIIQENDEFHCYEDNISILKSTYGYTM